MHRNVNWTSDLRIFRELFEASSALAWITDPDGHCVYLNKAWYTYTGMESGSALGFGWLEAIHPEDRTKARSVFFAAVDRRSMYTVGYQIRRADRRYQPACATGSPRINSDGVFLGHIGTTLTVENYSSQADEISLPSKKYQPLLTIREREVLRLIALGNTSDTIGAMLEISPKTVDVHAKSAARKLEASNRVSAVIKAIKLQEINV